MYNKHSYGIAATLAMLVALALFGCSGGNSGVDNGDGGAKTQVSAVEVSDNGSTATITVNFALSDNGNPLPGVAPGDIQFTVAKLIPPSSPSRWQSYINQLDGSETQATYEMGNADRRGIF